MQRSLSRLATDYLDIVLIHSDGDDLEIIDRLGTLDALMDLKQAGLVRAVGISTEAVPARSAALALGADVLMATLNADARDEADLIAAAGAAGCGVLVKKALASGHADRASVTSRAARGFPVWWSARSTRPICGRTHAVCAPEVDASTGLTP